MIIFNNPRIFETAIENASQKTQFKTTYFEIYDKSSEGVCDRLIIVQPFKWHIWAVNGLVYLLNESNKQCPMNYTPTILVPNTKGDLTTQVFEDKCINRVFNNIITNYTDTIIPAKVPYEITELQQEESKFTVLDALNFLVTKYITMDAPESPETFRLHDKYDKLKTDKLCALNTQKLNGLSVDISNTTDIRGIRRTLKARKQTKRASEDL